MSEVKGDPQDATLEESAQPTNAETFVQLALHPSVKGWRRKLYGMLAGESSEALSKLGIEQYIRVLLAESKDTSAEYCFAEALSEVMQNWTPTVWDSADRLNRILSLVAAFTPAVGFSKVLAHLERTGNCQRNEEPVSDEYEPVDLYKKGLVALAQYYPTPPYHSYDDFGFTAYRALLERNLEDERYSGYAAVRLLELNVLNFKSKQFESLLLTSDEAANAVFETLLDQADEPQELRSVGRKLGDMLAICAKADNIQRFKQLAKMNNATFDPEGDYQVFFPTLRSNDKVLEILVDLGDVKDTPLHGFVKYTTAKVKELLQEEPLNKDKIGPYISGYINHQTADMDELFEELETSDANIHGTESSFFLTVKEKKRTTEIKLKVNAALEAELVKRILYRLPTSFIVLPDNVIEFPTAKVA